MQLPPRHRDAEEPDASATGRRNTTALRARASSRARRLPKSVQSASKSKSRRHPRRSAVILSPFEISPGGAGVLRVRHVADVRFWARLRSQKRSDKGIGAGHVRDIASGASDTPLKITRPPRSSKPRKATWETPQSGLKITAGVCAFFLTSLVAERNAGTGRDAPGSRTLLYPGDPGPRRPAPPRRSGASGRLSEPGPAG